MSVSFNSSQNFQMNDQPTTPLRGCAFQPPSTSCAGQNLMPYFPPSPPSGPRDFGWKGPGDRSPAFPNQSGNFNLSMGSWNQGSYYNGSMTFPNQGGGSFNNSMMFWNQGGYYSSSMPLPNQTGYGGGSMPLPGMGGSANFSMGSWNQGSYFNGSTSLPGQIGYGNGSTPMPGMGGNSSISAGSWNQGNYFNSSTSFPNQGSNAICPPNGGQRNAWSDSGVSGNTSSINLGDYKMDLDKSDSSLTLTDPRTGNQTKVWGDPHVDFDANTSSPASTMANGPLQFTLPGNKQVFVNTQPSDTPGAPSYASDVYVVQGDRAYEVHGLSEKDNTPLSVNYVPHAGADLAQQLPQGAKHYVAGPGGMMDADTGRPARDSINA